jgi:hypothetical protein
VVIPADVMAKQLQGIIQSLIMPLRGVDQNPVEIENYRFYHMQG